MPPNKSFFFGFFRDLWVPQVLEESEDAMGQSEREAWTARQELLVLL